MTDSIANIGLQGVQRGLQSAARHAAELSTAFQGEGETDPIEPIVGLKSDALQVQASAKIIAVADSLNGSILDILA